MHSFTRHCAQLKSSGKQFSFCNKHEHKKVPTNHRDAPLWCSSAERIGLVKQQSHHFQFVKKRIMIKERRKLTESISPRRCVIALCSALGWSKASWYCTAWLIHAWRFPKSVASDVVKTRAIRRCIFRLVHPNILYMNGAAQWRIHKFFLSRHDFLQQVKSNPCVV